MRIGLQSWGTEGDFRPFVALARALSARGHEVRLVFTGVEGRDLTGLARSAGVEVRFVDDGYFVSHREEIARLASEGLRASAKDQFGNILRDLMDPVAASMLAAGRALASESDVVVGHLLAHPAAVAAEAEKTPFVTLALQPVFPSRAYPPSGAPALGRLGNPILWWLANHVMRQALLPRVNAMRAACGLPALPTLAPGGIGSPRAVLVAVSPSIFPRPADWPADVEVTGTLSLPEAAQGWDPEPRVRAFLDAGPPVFLSFGSMFGMDDAQTGQAVETFAAALERAGARGIVQAPASAIARAPRSDRVCYVERAPHAHLFPRCSVIVHHGGAGTMQSALLAGKPSVVVPHAADQFQWADTLHARGVAPRPLVRTKLAPAPLAARIRAMIDDPRATARAQSIGAALRAEDGATRTAERIERLAAQ